MTTLTKSHKIILAIASFSFVVGITMANDAKAQSHHKEKVKTRLELKQEQQEKAFELRAKSKQANHKADTLKKQQAEERKAAEDARMAAEKKAKAEEKLRQDEDVKNAEIKRGQEAQEIRQQDQNQPRTESNTNQSVNENSVESTPNTETTSQQVSRSDGFNFNGNHYDIGAFSGIGQVPASSLVYQWTDYTAHLHILVERLSVPGSTIRQLGVGSKVTINGNTYTIFNERYGVVNNSDAYASLSDGNPTVTIQVCDTEDPHSTLTIWYAS